MAKTIVLRDQHLRFLDQGVGLRMHIRSTGGTPENAQVDISHTSLCSHIRVDSWMLTQARTVSVDRLCKTCLKDARRFPHDWIEEVDE